jgi:hypothetical protein
MYTEYLVNRMKRQQEEMARKRERRMKKALKEEEKKRESAETAGKEEVRFRGLCALKCRMSQVPAPAVVSPVHRYARRLISSEACKVP